MVQCFFSCGSVEKLDGESISDFINTLNSDVNSQSIEPVTLLLGSKFLHAGLRKNDQSINRRALLFREYAKKNIEKRVEEVLALSQEEMKNCQHPDVVMNLIK